MGCGFAERTGDRVRPITLDVADHDGRPFCDEALIDGMADAALAGRPCDDGDLILQLPLAPPTACRHRH